MSSHYFVYFLHSTPAWFELSREWGTPFLLNEETHYAALLQNSNKIVPIRRELPGTCRVGRRSGGLHRDQYALFAATGPGVYTWNMTRRPTQWGSRPRVGTITSWSPQWGSTPGSWRVGRRSGGLDREVGLLRAGRRSGGLHQEHDASDSSVGGLHQEHDATQTTQWGVHTRNLTLRTAQWWVYTGNQAKGTCHTGFLDGGLAGPWSAGHTTPWSRSTAATVVVFYQVHDAPVIVGGGGSRKNIFAPSVTCNLYMYI